MKSSIRNNPITRVLSLVLLCAGLLVAIPSVAGAAQTADAACPPDSSSYASTMVLTVSPSTASAGEPVTISGTGYPPNSTVTLTYTVGTSTTVQTIGTAKVNSTGAFSFPWTVPAGTTAGELHISSSACSISKTTILSITVSKTTTTTPGAVTPTPTAGPAGPSHAGTAPLPVTGSDVLPLVAGGVALLVIGSLVVLSSRKRAQHI